jgi:hypothetical protein
VLGWGGRRCRRRSGQTLDRNPCRAADRKKKNRTSLHTRDLCSNERALRAGHNQT